MIIRRKDRFVFLLILAMSCMRIAQADSLSNSSNGVSQRDINLLIGRIEKTFSSPYVPHIDLGSDSVEKINMSSVNYLIASPLEDKRRCGRLYVYNIKSKRGESFEFALPGRVPGSDSLLECKNVNISVGSFGDQHVVKFLASQSDGINVQVYQSFALLLNRKICTSDELSSVSSGNLNDVRSLKISQEDLKKTKDAIDQDEHSYCVDLK